MPGTRSPQPLAPTPSDEQERLAELERCGALDASADAVFEGLARIAKRAFAAPVAFVNVVDRDDQVSKACLGADPRSVPRALGFCTHVVAAKAPLAVPDATRDPRFAGTPFVVGDPGIRFYAGAPIFGRGGHVLGTVGVFDEEPRRPPTPEDMGVLEDLALAAAGVFEQRRTAAELEAGERLYRQLGELASDAILVLAPDGTVVYANPHAGELFGYPLERLLGVRASTLLAPDDRAEFRAVLERPQGDGVIDSERRMTRADGSAIVCEVRARRMPDGAVQTVFRDVTEQRRHLSRMNAYAHFRKGLVQLVGDLMGAADERTVHRRVLDFAVEAIPGAQAGSILTADPDRPDRYRFTAANGYDLPLLERAPLLRHELQWDPDAPATQVLTGFERDSVDDPARSDAIWGAGPTDDIRGTLVAPARHDDRTAAWLLLDTFERPDEFDDDAREMAMVVAQQLAALLQRVALDRDLRRAALTDGLTGLPNREGVTRVLAEQLARGDETTVLFVDLDDFKFVNDSFGHGAGDELLRRVGERIAGFLRVGDVTARWAGDEFVVLLRSATRAERAPDVALRLLHALSRPFRVREQDLFVHASIGIATAVGRVEAGELIEWADIALHHAKRSGKNRYAIFEPEMRERLVLRRELEGDLRYALNHGEISVHYQPRIDLCSGRIRSVEALARWTHPKRGAISPGDFIPVAEETGMIHELGRQVLDLACRQARSWRQAGTPLRVAVNISAQQIARPDFVAGIRSMLEHHHLDSELLELEITESVAAGEGDGVVSKLDQLHELGVHVSIDDFGTAYSSLSRLRRLPIRSLKIDQSFVRDLDGDDPQRATSLVQAIITLARNLDLRVIAEGIETEAQREVLRALGADEAQGYLFARPAPASELAGIRTP